jgi:hypothetical protein
LRHFSARKNAEKKSRSLRIDAAILEPIYLMLCNIARSNGRNAMIQSHNADISPGSSSLLDWQLVYQAEEKVVRLKTSGPIDKTSFPAMLTAAVAHAKRYHCWCVLADHRNSTLRLDPLEIYYAPRVITASGADSRYFLALVFGQMTEDIQFMENVCRNAGLQLAVFTDLNAALQWLGAQANLLGSPSAVPSAE